jgi:spore germination protein GerM
MRKPKKNDPYRLLKSIPIFLLVFFIASIGFSCELLDGTLDTSSTSTSPETEVVPSDDNAAETQEEVETPGEENTGPEQKETEEEVILSEEEYEELSEQILLINVYYVDAQAEFLVAEEREVQGTYKEDFIIEAFKELLKDPGSDDNYNLIPDGTSIISAVYIDGNAILNLSQDFLANKGPDGAVDRLVINCIASTMTEIPDIEGVLFNIEGKKLDLYGSMDVKKPILRDESIISK